MATRNFSMVEYFNRLAADWKPKLSFNGKTREDWRQWRRKALAKLKELMGRWPERAPLAAETVWKVDREEGVTCEYVVFDSDPFMSIPCYVQYPTGTKPDRSTAAIVAVHGHGPYGKTPVAGWALNAGVRDNIQAHNYDYGRQLARAGFLTISPDLRVFGERGDGGNPYPGRDPCNVQFLRGGILGIYTLTLNVFDMMRAVDYLETRVEVDPKRIGIMGLSQGGAITAFAAALEPRFAAADISGYVNSWRGFGIGEANFCGSQVVPEIFYWMDVPDVAGLIAPRPLLIEMGVNDDCFKFEKLREGFQAVERIYAAAGASDRLQADVHPGAHAFSGRLAFDFFRKRLGK